MKHRISPRNLPCLFCSLILFSVYESQAKDATPTEVSIPPSTLDEVDDDSEMQRLLAVLDKYTEIATKTRLNADFVPGMVTVLHGEDLAASGKRNVWEALAEVPGIEPFVESTGVLSLNVRGAGFTFSSGNVKFLVNGIPQNSNLQGEARPVMILPIALVERIEVIRGPGSAVHGEYAYTGVINVITRDDEQLFVRAGEHDSYSGGATLGWRDTHDAWQLSLNLFAEDMAAGEVVSGPDLVDPAVTNAPGPVNDARDAHAAILTLSYHDFGLDAQYIESRHGEQYGVNNTLPSPGDRLQYDHVNSAVEARQGFGLASSRPPMRMAPPMSFYSGLPALRPSGLPLAVQNRSRRFSRTPGLHFPAGSPGAQTAGEFNPLPRGVCTQQPIPRTGDASAAWPQ